jgi:hypothetical protein
MLRGLCRHQWPNADLNVRAIVGGAPRLNNREQNVGGDQQLPRDHANSWNPQTKQAQQKGARDGENHDLQAIQG